MPVELIAFNASLVNDKVNLSWTTASELNNDFFTIERNINGEKFESIKTIKGKGTTNLTSVYTSIDENPVSGISYYRLKQTDFDGGYFYSDVVSVEFLGQDFWIIYPNPTNGINFNIKLSKDEIGKEVYIGLQSMNGQHLLSQTSIADASAKVTVEPSQELPSGIYIVSIITHEKVVKKKIIVK